jgi:hypothetical protein
MRAMDAVEAVVEFKQSMDPYPFIGRRGCGAFWGAILHVSASKTLAIMVRRGDVTRVPLLVSVLSCFPQQESRSVWSMGRCC